MGLALILVSGGFEAGMVFAVRVCVLFYLMPIQKMA